mgnify:CR=1 FL=1|jgi:hypothetical protein|nr:hypothetical protein [uncultured Dongia sp.]
MRTHRPNLRLLAAASRLDHFTASQLAAQAGVSYEAARSFVRRSRYIRRSGKGRSRGPGQPEAIYQIDPESKEVVAEELAEIRRVVGNIGAEVPALNEPTAQQLLEDTLVALERGAVLDPRDREEELRFADRYLMAVQAELKERRVLAYPVGIGEARALEDAQRRLARLRSDVQLDEPLAELPLSEVGRDLQGTMIQSMEDWTASLQPDALTEREAEHITRRHGIRHVIEQALETALAKAQAETAAYLPAAVLHRLRPALNVARRREAAATISDWLQQPSVRNDVFSVLALAMAASVIASGGAAEALLGAILSRSFNQGADRNARRVVRLALASLARPKSHEPHEAAAACLFLIGRTDADANDVEVMAPAALRAPRGSAAGVLTDLTEVLFRRSGSGRYAVERTNAGATLRNVACAFASENFAPLPEALVRLFNKGQPAFVDAIRDPRHKALIITDSSDEGGTAFVTWPHEPVAKVLDSDGPLRPTPLSIEINTDLGRYLQRRKTSEWEPSQEKTFHWVPAQRVDDSVVGRFTAQLAQKHRTEIRN